MKSKLFVTLMFLFSIVPFSFAQKDEAVKDTTAVVESKTTTDKSIFSMENAVFFVLSVICIVGGALLKHSMMKRKLERTNQCGVEEFNSYTKMVASTILENVFICIGQILFYVGVLFICMIMQDTIPILILVIIILFCLFRIIKSIFTLIVTFFRAFFI